MKTATALLVVTLALRGTPPAIGVVTAPGTFRMDDATVTANATLFEGATLETKAPAALDLAAGPHVSLFADSKGRIFGDHLVLERGAGEFHQAAGFHMEALGLRVQPETGEARARVSLSGTSRVDVAALAGSLRVLNARGLLIADLSPGTALEFALPQGGDAGASEPWRMTGCLRSVNGHLLLTDDTTNVTAELVGAGVAAQNGNRVEINGTLDSAATPISGATQVIRVTSMRRLGKGCAAGKGGAAAAGAGGTAAGKASSGKAAGGSAAGHAAGISVTTISIIGGVAAGAAVAGLAAADALSGQGHTMSR